MMWKVFEGVGVRERREEVEGGLFFSFCRCAHRWSWACYSRFFLLFRSLNRPFALISTYRQQALLSRGQPREEDLERGTSHSLKCCRGKEKEREGGNPIDGRGDEKKQNEGR